MLTRTRIFARVQLLIGRTKLIATVRRRAVLGFLGLVSVLNIAVDASPARADGPLKSEIERQVGVIRSAMRDATDIAIREFTFDSTDELNGHIGPGLRAAYEEAFRAAGLVVNDKANHELSGKCETKLQAGKPLRLTITPKLTKKDDQSTLDLLAINAPLDAKHFATINSTPDLARAIGFTGQLSSQDAGAAKRQAEIADQLKAPKPLIEATRVRGSPTSEYAVELRKRPGGNDKAEFTPVLPQLEDGLLVAPVARNDEYEIWIHSRSPLPVAVSVTIDGLDVFHFADKANRDEQGRPRFTHFIVQPNSSSLIPGWFQKLETPNNYLAFLVTEHGKGALSQANKAGFVPRDNVGAIHVQFAHCQPLAEGARPKSGSETGFGVPRSIEQKAVRFQIEPPHEFLTLRYDRNK